MDKREQSFVAFCALGNAEAFFAQLRRENFSLAATRAFADHHVYRPDEIDALIREARTRQAAALLTTAKDAVKLRSLAVEFPCFVVEASLVIEEEERLREMVRRVVSAR